MTRTETGQLRLLLVDDHALFREGVERVLAARLPNACLRCAANAAEGQAMLDCVSFDLILLDVALGSDDGISVLRQWRARSECPPIAMLSASASAAIMNAALAEGARGFIPKTVDGALLVGAIELIRAGGIYVPLELLAVQSPVAASPQRPASADTLTPRQLEVLGLLAEGRSNKDIARRLDMADGTVRTHINAIFRALDANNRTQAVLRAQQLSWI